MYMELAQVARDIESAAPGFEVGWLDAYVWLKYGYIKDPSRSQLAEARGEYWRFLQAQASRYGAEPALGGNEPANRGYALRHVVVTER